MDSTSIVCPEQHPLLLDPILENIFIIISDSWKPKEALEALLQCRRVCKSWEILARKKVQCHATVSLTRQKHVNCDFGHFGRTCNRSLFEVKSYMDYLKSKPLLPYTNFDLFRLPLKDKHAAEFISKVGPNIQSISLHYYDNVEIDSETLFNLFQTAGDNLRDLDISFLPSAVVGEGFFSEVNNRTILYNVKKLFIRLQFDACEAFYRDILFSAKDLAKLKIMFIDALEEDTEVLRKFVSLLPGIPAVAHHYLKHLEIQLVTKCTLLDIFPICQLQLVSLSLLDSPVVIAGVESSHRFKTFFQKLSNTLKYLRLDHLTREYALELFEIPLSLPALPHLIELKCHADDQPLGLTAICYAELFPNLKILNMHANSWNIASFLSVDCNDRHVTLDTLRVKFSSYMYSPLEIMAAARIFPVIRNIELEVGCSPANRLIFTLWPQLESLNICFYFTTKLKDNSASFLSPDCLFTGLSSDQCEMIQDLDNPLDFINQKGFASIADLKSLRRLSVNTRYDHSTLSQLYTRFISNASIWAFSKFSSLESMRLPINSDIDDTGFQILLQTFPRAVIERKNRATFHD